MNQSWTLRKISTVTLAADNFFKAKFNTGELCRRLWHGALRKSLDGYSFRDAYNLTQSLADGFGARFEDDNTVKLVISDLVKF